MCVIFFYVNSNPGPGGYKLILASNRDEFFSRDTRYVTKWENAGHVYGGIDLEPGREGGTWLAIGGLKHVFKVGALLNLTGEPKARDAVEKHIISPISSDVPIATKNARTSTSTSTTQIHCNNLLLGRGMIVTDFVKNFNSDHTIENYTNQLVGDCTKYSAFNFIAIEIGPSTTPAKIVHCSNAPVGLKYYEEGQCYAFGNSLPTAPFEKVRHGEKVFRTIVEDFHGKHLPGTDSVSIKRMKLIDELLALLKSKQKFWPDAELERRAPTWGEHLSAINCSVPNLGYGSRTHTIILVDSDDKMHFFEETMASENPKDEWLKTLIEKQYFKDL